MSILEASEKEKGDEGGLCLNLNLTLTPQPITLTPKL